MGLAEKYPVRYTIEDWKHWQGDWELVEGIPYAIALPRPINQITLIKLGHLLYSTLEDCKDCKVAGELDWYISYDTVIRPGLMVLCGEIPERVESPPQMIKVFELVEGKYREKRERSFSFEEFKVEIKA